MLHAESEEYGKLLWNAHCKTVNFTSYAGKRLPTYDKMTEDSKNQWSKTACEFLESLQAMHKNPLSSLKKKTKTMSE